MNQNTVYKLIKFYNEAYNRTVILKSKCNNMKEASKYDIMIHLYKNRVKELRIKCEY
jgi:hypothetical protein